MSNIDIEKTQEEAAKAADTQTSEEADEDLTEAGWAQAKQDLS